MVFVTLLSLYLLPVTRSVKVVIDGTIDVGPNWNFVYKFNPVSSFDPENIIPDNSYVLRNNNHINTKVPEKGINENTNNNGHETLGTEDSSSYDGTSEEGPLKVTKTYHTDVKDEGIFTNTSKIKDEVEIINFFELIKNKSLQMFDNVREKLDKQFVQKIIELKQRYANRFTAFENATKDYTIKTAFGHDKVILNTVNYSNKLLSRLFNRFKIDIRNDTFTTGLDPIKIFKEHKDLLKIVTNEDVCNKFGICRAGNEFTDHISDLVGILLKEDDATVQLSVEQFIEVLKAVNFSRIMDNVTQEAFRDGLSKVQELDPFEQRVLLMSFKLISDKRHEPFQESDPKDKSVNATITLLHIMEEFNKKIVIEPKYWKRVKKDYNRWLDGDKVDVYGVFAKLVKHVEKKIQSLDEKTANDFKAYFRQCVSEKTFNVILITYGQLHHL